MKKIIFAVVWLLSFVLLLVVCDQFLLRYPGGNTVLLNDFQRFYKDVRQRVVNLSTTKNQKTVKQIIAQRMQRVGGVAAEGKITTKNPTAISAHYVYLDSQQTLNFADSWEEIPLQFRKNAKRLDN